MIDKKIIEIADKIKVKSDELKKRLKRIEKSVKGWHIYSLEGINLTEELNTICCIIIELDKLIAQYPISYQNKNINPVSYVEIKANENNRYLTTHVEWDYRLFKDLGFSEKEYNSVVSFKDNLKNYNLNIEKAYRAFIKYVIEKNKEEEAEEEDFKKIITGGKAMTIISNDVIMYNYSELVPALISSVVSGLSVIALDNRKILKILRKIKKF